ncbi:uncharacterized protein [Oscarella lobularis]|uniref:uncharacterized protein isoform X2 n=1 Tax=Oscarella lobularis TaxID=121494 RepID=UPI003313F2DA
MAAVVLFALVSVVCLCHSDAFHLAENFPRQNFEVQGMLRCSELKLLSQVTDGVSVCNYRNTKCSRPRHRLLSHVGKELFSGHHKYQLVHLCARANKDRRVFHYAASSESHAKEKLSSFDFSFQSMSSFIFTIPVFSSLLFIFISLFSYLHPRKFDSSKNRRLTASSSGKRQHQRILLSVLFQCDRLLFVSFLVAVVFARSTDAVDSTFQESCKECDPGWMCYLSSCLKISTQPLSWSKAAEMCSKQEAHLWSIDKDDAVLRDYLDSWFRQTAFLIGLVSSPIARGAYSYRWSDESPFVYSNWELLNARCEDDLCTTIIPTRKTTGSIINWISVACSSPNQFICEKPKKLTTADVRLVNGVTPNRGRLEVLLDGAWRRVCMAKSSVNVSQTAVAVCRHLGYPDVFFARSLNLSGEGSKANFSFFVDCMWIVDTISCSYERVTCDSDLFISCQSSRKHSVGVRLANGSLPSEGILQIGIGGIWRNVCGVFIDSSTSNIICKHLGYARGYVSKTFFRGASFKSFVASCDSWNTPFGDCRFFEMSCDSFSAIKCFNAEWQVRLVNTADKTNVTDGNVEVFRNETWTFICGSDNSKWELTGANVACRQLGFTKAALAYSEDPKLTSRSQNQNHSFLTVACNGSEMSLRDCEHMSSQNHSCRKAVAVCKKNEYCPLGWILYADYCYGFSKLWFMDGELGINAGGCGRTNSASINSPHEQAFVMSLLADESDVFIGLRREDDDAFKWMNGEPLRYVLWAPEEPMSNYKCVVIDFRNGYWKTADCSESISLLCKISLRDMENGIRQETAPSMHGRCRKDELYFKSACYYWSKDEDEPVSQEVAQNEKCRSRNAALVSISTVYENAFVAKETSPVPESLYWTGLVYNDTSAQEAFTWLDTSPVIFTKWGKYEPAYPKREKKGCVLFGSDGREFVWSVSNCSAKAQYVCKRFLNESDNFNILASPETLPTGDVYSCPNGWTMIGTRSCFKRVSERKTWHDSMMDCEIIETRSSLARILSVQEQKELSLYLLKEEEEAWIGLNDVSNEGFYIWSDGSPLVYVNWTLFEADTNSSLQNEQDCVAATKSLWKLDICSKKKASVCFTPATPNFDECSNNTDNCHVNATCENTISSYICTCKPGFIGNGTKCEDYDECSNNADNCHVNATCQNIISSYTCTCKAGFTGNGTKCEDLDECEYSCKEENQNCSNTLGSHECGCLRGWTMNGSRCVDINECNLRDICHSQAKCINELGSYQCECLPGWTGNGRICLDINECKLNYNNSCHLRANCTNYEGGYNCTCLEGWTGNGSFCVDVNECEMNNLCHSQAYCTNQNGTYNCTCRPGWNGDGFFCSESKVSTDESNSQWKIILSVVCSFTFVAFVIIACVVYARRKAFRLNSFGLDFAEPSDKWEVNSGDMTLLEKLGDGFFGVVYKAYLYHSLSERISMLARKESNSLSYEKSVVACKMLKEKNLAEEELLDEIKLMKRIGQHPHIVSLLGCITTSKPFCLIVEYCINGDLLNYIRKGKIKCSDDTEQHSNESELKCESLSEDDTPTPSPGLSAHNHQWRETNEEDSSEVKNVVDDEGDEERKVEQDFSARDLMSFVWQIASGMEYLSGKGLVHRDLACRNVLVCDDKLLKVSDFGLTRCVYHDGAYCQKTTRRLPLRWMSIEAITQRLFSEQSDVWSFGVVMWEICTLGSFPYPCVSGGKLLSHLRSGNRLTCPENCSAELYKIMSACWSADSENRPAFSRLTQLLGKMLEAENQSQYIDFDATSSLSSYEIESRSGRRESKSVDEDLSLNSVTQVMVRGKGDDVRYVAGSATSAIAEAYV